MTAPARIEYADGARVFCDALAAAVRPRQRLSVSQWADAHRVLSPKASDQAGPWRTSRTPYLQEIMDCLSERSPVRTVVVMSCTQIGKSEIGFNWIGYILHHAPGPTLAVLPTIEARRRWVAQRLVPLITETPVLAQVLDAKRSRATSNSADIKDFPGGMLVIGGANSPASLASMPIRYVLCDELDRFPWQVGQEGDPLGLIRERQKTFPRRKELLTSTPTVKDASRIEEEYENSDQREYHLPCPHCDELLVLRWNQLQWDRGLKRAWYVCEHCGAEIEESAKPKMLAAGRWIPKHPKRSTRGYHINALYAPLGMGYTWLELAQEWVKVHKDPIKLKRFINTALGQTWEDRSRHVKAEQLSERAEEHRTRTLPPGCLLLTAGVDVQDDRLAFQLLGWGRGETTWTVDWGELPGDPARDAVWTALAELLNRPVRNAYGRDVYLSATAIDTGGHHTHRVYQWIRSKPIKRAMAIKGSSTPGRAILGGRPQHQDVTVGGRTIKNGVKLWMIGTDTAKHAIFSRLRADQGVAAGDRLWHFPADLELDYYQQLTSEAFDPERNRWMKRRGRRNEALDTAVYAMAAAQHPEVRVHRMRKRDWDRLAAALEPDGEQAQQETASDVQESARDAAQPAKRRGRGQHRKRVGLGSEEWSL